MHLMISKETTMTSDVTTQPDHSHERDGRKRTHSRPSRAEQTTELLGRMAAVTDTLERQRLVEEIVLLNMGVAKAIARRYYGKGIHDDDLDQVAYLALLQATRRFDPKHGRDFLSYAVPTIRGELRKNFRDSGWTVRPPRPVQELQARIRSANDDLLQSLGRSPRPSEVAEHLDVDLDLVLEALAANGCFHPTSLDQPLSDDGDSVVVGDLLTDDGADLEAADARLLLGPLLRRLSERDRRIVELRFFRGLTQQEIAEDIGVTQMHVSRLLSRLLANLREQLTDRLEQLG